MATLSLLTISSMANEKADAYKKGCDLGNAKACTNLGYMYGTGKGVAENKYKAVELYRKGCNGGNARGCTNLGNLLE